MRCFGIGGFGNVTFTEVGQAVPDKPLAISCRISIRPKYRRLLCSRLLFGWNVIARLTKHYFAIIFGGAVRLSLTYALEKQATILTQKKAMYRIRYSAFSFDEVECLNDAGENPPGCPVRTVSVFAEWLCRLNFSV